MENGARIYTDGCKQERDSGRITNLENYTSKFNMTQFIIKLRNSFRKWLLPQDMSVIPHKSLTRATSCPFGRISLVSSSSLPSSSIHSPYVGAGT